MNPHTILLLAANPAKMPRLKVDDEARDIRIALPDPAVPYPASLDEFVTTYLALVRLAARA
jgi:hypothetical protein